MNSNELSVVESLTHDEISEVGAQWLRNNGYPIAFANMASATNGEQPDALGMNSYAQSFLLEAKVSRSDFAADKAKPWRSWGKGAVGDSRGYITPKGLLKPEEIPYGWWLLEVHGKTKPIVKVIKGKRMKRRPDYCSVPEFYNCTVEELNHFHGSSVKQPLTWMLKILRRAAEDGVDIAKYSSGNAKRAV